MSAECYIGLEQAVNPKGRCCCNCQSHLEDFHHCSTVTNKTGCVCSTHKGWICVSDGRAFSGWMEHGMCELHQFKIDATS